MPTEAGQSGGDTPRMGRVPGDAPAPGLVHVSVVYSPAARQVWEKALSLPAGATARQALEASGVLEAFAELRSPARPRLGVWGRKAGGDETLRDRDRVELYRPLQVDPKLARRERFRQQGARAAGLFARPGSGGKADG